MINKNFQGQFSQIIKDMGLPLQSMALSDFMKKSANTKQLKEKQTELKTFEELYTDTNNGNLTAFLNLTNDFNKKTDYDNDNNFGSAFAFDKFLKYAQINTQGKMLNTTLSALSLPIFAHALSNLRFHIELNNENGEKTVKIPFNMMSLVFASSGIGKDRTKDFTFNLVKKTKDITRFINLLTDLKNATLEYFAHKKVDHTFDKKSGDLIGFDPETHIDNVVQNILARTSYKTEDPFKDYIMSSGSTPEGITNVASKISKLPLGSFMVIENEYLSAMNNSSGKQNLEGVVRIFAKAYDKGDIDRKYIKDQINREETIEDGSVRMNMLLFSSPAGLEKPQNIDTITEQLTNMTGRRGLFAKITYSNTEEVQDKVNNHKISVQKYWTELSQTHLEMDLKKARQNSQNYINLLSTNTDEVLKLSEEISDNIINLTPFKNGNFIDYIIAGETSLDLNDSTPWYENVYIKDLLKGGFSSFKSKFLKEYILLPYSEFSPEEIGINEIPANLSEQSENHIHTYHSDIIKRISSLHNFEDVFDEIVENNTKIRLDEEAEGIFRTLREMDSAFAQIFARLNNQMGITDEFLTNHFNGRSSNLLRIAGILTVLNGQNIIDIETLLKANTLLSQHTKEFIRFQNDISLKGANKLIYDIYVGNIVHGSVKEFTKRELVENRYVDYKSDLSDHLFMKEEYVFKVNKYLKDIVYVSYDNLRKSLVFKWFYGKKEAESFYYQIKSKNKGQTIYANPNEMHDKLFGNFLQFLDTEDNKTHTKSITGLVNSQDKTKEKLNVANIIFLPIFNDTKINLQETIMSKDYSLMGILYKEEVDLVKGFVALPISAEITENEYEPLIKILGKKVLGIDYSDNQLSFEIPLPTSDNVDKIFIPELVETKIGDFNQEIKLVLIEKDTKLDKTHKKEISAELLNEDYQDKLAEKLDDFNSDLYLKISNKNCKFDKNHKIIPQGKISKGASSKKYILDNYSDVMEILVSGQKVLHEKNRLFNALINTGKDLISKGMNIEEVRHHFITPVLSEYPLLENIQDFVTEMIEDIMVSRKVTNNLLTKLKDKQLNQIYSIIFKENSQFKAISDVKDVSKHLDTFYNLGQTSSEYEPFITMLEETYNKLKEIPKPVEKPVEIDKRFVVKNVMNFKEKITQIYSEDTGNNINAHQLILNYVKANLSNKNIKNIGLSLGNILADEDFGYGSDHMSKFEQVVNVYCDLILQLAKNNQNIPEEFTNNYGKSPKTFVKNFIAKHQIKDVVDIVSLDKWFENDYDYLFEDTNFENKSEVSKGLELLKQNLFTKYSLTPTNTYYTEFVWEGDE